MNKTCFSTWINICWSILQKLLQKITSSWPKFIQQSQKKQILSHTSTILGQDTSIKFYLKVPLGITLKKNNEQKNNVWIGIFSNHLWITKISFHYYQLHHFIVLLCQWSNLRHDSDDDLIPNLVDHYCSLRTIHSNLPSRHQPLTRRRKEEKEKNLFPVHLKDFFISLLTWKRYLQPWREHSDHLLTYRLMNALIFVVSTFVCYTVWN